MEGIFMTSIVFSIGAIISDIGIRIKRMIDKIEKRGTIAQDDCFIIWFGLLGTLVIAWIPLFNVYILVLNIMKRIGVVEIE